MATLNRKLQAGEIPVFDAKFSLEFEAFKLCAVPVTYQRLLRIAIHEGAHVADWYECMRATGNLFTDDDWRKLETSRHGKTLSG